MNSCLISPAAIRDLNEIFDYFASCSVEAGEEFVAVFEQKCQNIAKFPQMGRSYAELEPSVRGVPIKEYIIFYRPYTGGVEIVRVVSGYRNLESLFSEKDS